MGWKGRLPTDWGEVTEVTALKGKGVGGCVKDMIESGNYRVGRVQEEQSEAGERCGAAVTVQSLSHVRLLQIPWTAACQASLSFTVPQSLLKLIPIVSNAI